jgi:NADH-quinone oxidoreductase subunit L
MTLPLIVLAVLSTVGGFIGVPYAMSSFFTHKDVNVLEHTLEPAVASIPVATPGEPAAAVPAEGAHERAFVPIEEVAHATHSSEEISAERWLALVSVLIGFAGIGLGWVIFQKRPLTQMPRILENKYYVDEVYDAALIHPIEGASREGLWKMFDIGVIDGILHGLGDAVTELGRLARYLQAGFVRGYAAIILVGALILIGLFAWMGYPK